MAGLIQFGVVAAKRLVLLHMLSLAPTLASSGRALLCP